MQLVLMDAGGYWGKMTPGCTDKFELETSPANVLIS